MMISINPIMAYTVWSPSYSTSWQPTIGWNRAFSERERLECAHLYVFFTERKKYSEEKAEQLAYMAVLKQKYPGMVYSAIQEADLARALKPIDYSVGMSIRPNMVKKKHPVRIKIPETVGAPPGVVKDTTFPRTR
jgi:hypothetical protein